LGVAFSGDYSVPAGPFGCVEGTVGDCHEILRGRAVGGPGHRSGRDGDREGDLRVDFHRAAVYRNAQAVRGRGELMAGYAWHQDGELLAAIPGDHITGAGGGADLLSDLDEHPVPAGMPVGVVDGLEVVDIEGDQTNRLVATLCTF